MKPTTDSKPIVLTKQDDSYLESLVEALCQREGVGMMELEPLYSSVDIEALDRLLSYRDSDTVVSFETNGWVVTLGSDGKATFDKE